MADNNMSADGYTGTPSGLVDECFNLDGGDDFDPASAECVEEHVEGQLTAPDENFPHDHKEWYHGRLDRQTSEERLMEADNEGSYLIRESDRKPGSFVLSYLGKAKQPTHFRIIAMCGDYYIGGRQFESLSDLIGYYTKWSWLLKDEQLRHPVPPPEPVDDRRRVVAMLYYKKMPDTDELSMEKGDMFIVHNELENGWLWVTSVKTQNSGIIPAALVEDLNGTSDSHDSCPYFHNCISKDEAVTKLGQAGPGSYLVRPSDNTPGALSLFFFSDMVRRFRIEKKGKKMFVGGRFFDSLDEIISRYKTEEIVEGFKLLKPVIRDNFDMQFVGKFLTQLETNTLYASIMQSGPNLLTSRNDQIDLTGYLLKRNDKKKWKQFYTMLNGTEKHLLLFENERRSRPKNLIELQYSSLYPVHDSLFCRSFVFQLVSNYNNNHVQTFHLAAETSDGAQKWIRALKPYCQNTPAKRSLRNNCIKELYSLTITVKEAHNLHLKYLNHPYAVVSLNDVRVARTDVAEPQNPVWEQEFILDDIPNDVESFNVGLFNKVKRTKESKVAEVTVPLSKEGDPVSDWLKLHPSSPNLRGDMGTVRVEAQYVHEVIMAIEEYSVLKELLLGDNYENIQAMFKVCFKTEWLVLSKSLLRIFRYEKKEARLLRTLNDLEIDKEEQVSQLFRAASAATTMMDQYMKMTATAFVEAAVKDCVRKIVESKQSCELNPAFLDNPSDARSNQEYFLSLLNCVVEAIFKATEVCPTVLRYICGCLQRKAQEKWPDDDTVKTRAVSGFIFLRLLCPAIISPKSFNLVSENPSEVALRTLKLVAKAIQNLANLVESGTKEPYMEFAQSFIKRNKDRVVSFIDNLSNMPPNHYPLDLESPEGDEARDLAIVHQLGHTHLKDLKAKAETQPGLKKFILVTEKLSTRKQIMLES